MGGQPDPHGRGLEALRRVVLSLVLEPLTDQRMLAMATGAPPHAYAAPAGPGAPDPALTIAQRPDTTTDGSPRPDDGGFGDADLAASSEDDATERERLIALVELARQGDSEAFGMLYDHYHASVYRFLYYRTRSGELAEDLTADTFFRALRSMTNFRWQGRDFGAWLMTIARNLATDHFKAGRTRLEVSTDDMGQHDDATDSPESAVLANLTNEILLGALTQLPDEQRDCLVMRFLQGLSIAETAERLRRSDGAVKQLQLRGVRNLAKRMPEGLRGT